MFRQHNKRKCALCNKIVGKFVPIEAYYIQEAVKYGYDIGKPETMNEQEYSCPYCYGADRDRLTALFFIRLKKMARGGVFYRLTLLDIAPSGAVQKFLFGQLGEITYSSADLFMEDVDYRADIQNMSLIEDETYDLFICSHVLEHVKDDRKALKELYRILKADGIGIILVPIDLKQDNIDEKWGLPAEENWRRFGQGDHVRKYSKKGFVERLEEAGFHVSQLGRGYFGKKAFEENSINKEAVLYLLDKRTDNKKEDVCEYFVNNHKFFPSDINSYKTVYAGNNKYNYYIDKLEYGSSHLYIWGWFYFENANSKWTKLKLLLFTNGQEMIFGIRLRKREDIEQAFNNNKDGSYIYSGIELELQKEVIPTWEYEVYLLAENNSRHAMIKLSECRVLENINESNDNINIV